MAEDFESLVLAFEAANTGLWEVFVTPEEELTQRVRRSVNEIRRFREHCREELGATAVLTGKEPLYGASGAGAAVSEPLLSTGVAAVDALLGGGLLRRTVTELSGPASAGKTCLCCQIAVEHGAAAVYFTLEESVAALSRRMKDIVDAREQALPACRFAAVKTLEELRRGLFALRRAPADRRPTVVIVDSIAAALHPDPASCEAATPRHARSPGHAARAKPELLAAMQRLALKRFAFELNAAVVVTNHVRDAERPPSPADVPPYHARIQQALVEGDCAPPHRELRQRPMNGFQLAEFIHARLLLTRSAQVLSGGREARLVFSRTAAPGRVALEMRSAGLEGRDGRAATEVVHDVREPLVENDSPVGFEPLTPALESTPI